MPLSPTQVKAVYADAVAEFREDHDPTFEAPDLRYTDLPEDDGIRYDRHSYAMRVDTTAVRGMDALQDAFSDRFDAAYTDVVEDTVTDAFDDLTAAYPFLGGTNIGGGVSFTDITEDYTLAINPTTPAVVLDDQKRRHIDPETGNITDMLAGQVRQQVAHVLLHHEGLYEEPGLRPYWLYIDEDTPVVNEHGARHAFEEAVDAFQEEYDEDFESPELVLDDEPYDWDREADRITLDARILSELNHELLKDDFLLTFKTFYDESLHDGLEQAIDWLETLHGLDDDIQIDEAFFKDLGSGTAANYNRSNKRVRIDEGYMDSFDPDTGRFNAIKPDSSRVHEVEHGRDYQCNPFAELWRSDRFGTGTVYGEDRAYKEDIRNATQEIKTTFVQWLFGHTDGRTSVHRAIEDPWHMPDFFEGYLDIYGEREAGTVRDPYGFGLFTARSLLDGFREKHGPEKGLDLTLDYLQTVTTTPEGMQGTLERSLDMRDTPSYPRTLEWFHHALEETDPGDKGITTFAAYFTEQLEDAHTRDEHLDPYLQARALLEGFETAHPEALHPAELETLQERVDAVKESYVDEEAAAGEHPEWLEKELEKRFP